MAPLTGVALDMAFDTMSGGGMGLLACGSGRKLKTAISRAVAPTQTPALNQPAPSIFCCPLSTIKSSPHGKPGRDAWHMQNRYSSSLRPAKLASISRADVARPHVSQASAVPNPRSHAACEAGAASWVCDPGEFLSSTAQADLQEALACLNYNTGSECALVVMADLQDRRTNQDFKIFGVSLFNAWGLGSATHHNGVVVMLFHQARRLEIITGTGMHTVLPDAWLAEMQQRVMVPHLHSGNYAAGLKAGISAIEQRLASSAPDEWRDSSLSAEQSPVSAGANTSLQVMPSSSFGGGDSRSCPTNMSQLRDVNSVFQSDVSMKLLGGLLLLGGLACTETGEGSKLKQLEKQLRELDEPSVFTDATGASLPWPYQSPPSHMDMLDVTLHPAPASQDHPFNLACSRKLTVCATANGFGQRSLEVNFHNISQDDVVLHLPAGALFVAGSDCSRIQPLISKEAVRERIASGEKMTVLLDAYCGDSGASIPAGNMTLSPYMLQEAHLGTQLSVWRWAARFQQIGQTERCPAAADFRTLEHSFGIAREEAEQWFAQLQADVNRGHAEREQQKDVLRSSIHVEQARLKRLAEERARSRSESRRGGGWSSSGSSFGGGCSSGGGAGCSF